MSKVSLINGHIDEEKDMVEVIRCKDCKHFQENYCYSYQWWNDDSAVIVGDTDFCSYGERKETE